MINVTTKLEVPSFIRYGDTEVVEKCTKWGCLAWLGVTQGHRQCHHSIERIRHPIRL